MEIKGGVQEDVKILPTMKRFQGSFTKSTNKMC